MPVPHTYIEVPGGQYQCVGPAMLRGDNFDAGVTVDIVQKQQGQPDASYQAIAESSPLPDPPGGSTPGRFSIQVNLPAPGAIAFIASVAGSQIDRTKVTAQAC